MGKEINELFGLEIKIESFEETTMSNGEDAYLILLRIDNKTLKRRKINLLKSTYVTKEREQIEQDIWLSGYITGEDSLKKNSFKKAGLVFYQSKLKRISDNDLIYISIELPNEGIEITLCYQKNENNWVLINKEKTEIKIKLTPKQLEKNLLKRIERLEAFEERLGVSFQNISIKIEVNNWFTVFCEVHSTNGTTINDDLSIECVLYDKDGSILNKEKKDILSDDFFGFELLHMNFYEDLIAEKVNKIRIYPKK